MASARPSSSRAARRIRACIMYRGLQEAREVVEDELGVAGGAEPDDGEPGGLGLGAHDGQVFPDQGVEEGGLADVGDAGEGDMAGLRHAES